MFLNLRRQKARHHSTDEKSKFQRDQVLAKVFKVTKTTLNPNARYLVLHSLPKAVVLPDSWQAKYYGWIPFSVPFNLSF